MNKLVVSGVSALAVGAVGTGVYLATQGSANAETTASEQVAAQVAGEPMAADQSADGRKPGRRLRARRLLRGGVHGEATVRTKKGFVQVAWQRGQLTGKSGATLTVRSLDGTVWQWQTDGNTRVRKNAQKSAVSNLATGDYVVVAGLLGPGDRHTAKAVIVPKKVPAAATQSPAPTPS
jgi:hypothetical protein